jgi:GNAT superfamily N-acetyltransferase
VTSEFLPQVGPEALDAIQRLCARSFAPVLSSSELAKTLFAPDQPAVVRFSPHVGIVATVRGQEGGSIRLIAVDPSSRTLGNGHRLVEVAECDLEGAPVVTVGADPPYFLFPGVSSEQTALCYLLERHHFSREESNYNVVVELAELPAGAGEAEEPLPSEREAIDAWSTEHWPNWRAELLRAFDQESLLVTRDSRGIAAACAFDVNRSATLGPIASRPDLIGKGAAGGLLLGALRRMRQIGYTSVEVLWVGPLVPYVRVGGTIGQVFFVYRKRRLAS